MSETNLEFINHLNEEKLIIKTKWQLIVEYNILKVKGKKIGC